MRDLAGRRQLRPLSRLDVELWRGGRAARPARAAARRAAGAVRLRAHRPRPSWRRAREGRLPPAGARACPPTGRPRRRPSASGSADPSGVDSRAAHRREETAMSTAEAPTHLRENPLRARAPTAAPRRGDVRDRPEPDQRSREVQEVGRGLDPGDDGRRLRRRLPRPPRHPQHRPRPVEGRDPLPPGRHAATRSSRSRCG